MADYFSAAESVEYMKEFTQRGFECINTKKKFLKFSKRGMEDFPIFWLTVIKDDERRFKHDFLFSPHTDSTRISFQIKREKNGKPYFYKHSDLSPFPKDPNPKSGAKKIQNIAFKGSFTSAKSLGDALDTLLSIWPVSDNACGELSLNNKSTSIQTFCPTQEQSNPGNDPEDELTSVVVVEGGKKKVLSTVYERNPKLRRLVLEKFGYDCRVCGFNFLKMYGELGRDYVEVHHLVPVSEGEVENNYRNLLPLCPNCHRMVHKFINRNPSKFKESIDYLKKVIKERK